MSAIVKLCGVETLTCKGKVLIDFTEEELDKLIRLMCAKLKDVQENIDYISTHETFPNDVAIKDYNSAHKELTTALGYAEEYLDNLDKMQ